MVGGTDPEYMMIANWTPLQLGEGMTGSHLVLVDQQGRMIGEHCEIIRAKRLLEISSLTHRAGGALQRIDAGEADLLIVRIATSGSSSDWLDAGRLVADAMLQYDVTVLHIPPSAEIGSADSFARFLQSLLHHGFRRSEGHAGRGAQRWLVVAPDDIDAAGRENVSASIVNQVRAWVEQSPNRLTPVVFAAEARARLEACGALVRVLEPAALAALGADALLAVGRGSEHGAHLVVAEWRGAPKRSAWDAALVGKGLTFDAGGLNLKASPVIEKMKIDMAGGAAVLGAFEDAVRRGLELNIVVLVPMVENMVDALCYRPGDVIDSLAGVSIEVGNTDAEGRLVLADAISLAIRDYSPCWLVDMATLTGLAAAVLHDEFGALYATNDDLAMALERAGSTVGERLWRLPLVVEQDYLVASDIADVSNWGKAGYLGVGMSSPAAGAKFLQKFVGDTRWAHIDMVGPAWTSRETARFAKGATGFGVRLLAQWLADLEAEGRRPGRQLRSRRRQRLNVNNEHITAAIEPTRKLH